MLGWFFAGLAWDFVICLQSDHRKKLERYVTDAVESGYGCGYSSGFRDGRNHGLRTAIREAKRIGMIPDDAEVYFEIIDADGVERLDIRNT